MYQLKAVTNCLNASQELCKNYKDTKARFQDDTVLDSNYMLANYSYKTLQHMGRNSKDPWVHRALKNREPEPPYQSAQLICEEPKQEIILQKEAAKAPLPDLPKSETGPTENKQCQGLSVKVSVLFLNYSTPTGPYLEM